jgi:hypothetical protein
MRTLMKTVLLAALLLATASTMRAQVSVGIVIGAPPPPRVVVAVPERPGPEFVWVEGYWYPVGNHYRWHGGYWTRPPYEGARWVGPRHNGERYYTGYWEENTAAWSTIITGTAATTGITTAEATTGTTIITTTITTTITTMIGNARHRNRVVDLTERVSLATALCIE